MSSSPPAESPQDRARVPRTAAPGVAAAGRTRYASGGRFTAEAAAVAARHGAAGERALPWPHPLLLRPQPGPRGDRLIEIRQTARIVLENVLFGDQPVSAGGRGGAPRPCHDQR